MELFTSVIMCFIRFLSHKTFRKSSFFFFQFSLISCENTVLVLLVRFRHQNHLIRVQTR